MPVPVMTHEARLALARSRFDEWLAGLPHTYEDDPERDAKLAAQAFVMTRLSTAEERDALFWFTISVVDRFLEERPLPVRVVLGDLPADPSKN